jgi:hypothetical protein
MNEESGIKKKWNAVIKKWKVYDVKNLNHPFCHKVSFLTGPHC